MTRAPPTPFVLSTAAALGAALAAACQGPAPTVPGPAYTPATADMIKALAAECQIQTAPEGETRDCRGRQATVRIELDPERRIRVLDMTVLASTGVDEAWVLYRNVLPVVVGDAISDAVHRKLRGEPAADPAGGPRIATTIDGQRYLVKLTWGR